MDMFLRNDFTKRIVPRKRENSNGEKKGTVRTQSSTKQRTYEVLAVIGNPFFILCSVFAQMLLLNHNLATLSAVTFPTKRLKVFLYSTTTLGNRNDMVYLQQEVRFHMGGVPTIATREVVSFFDKFT